MHSNNWYNRYGKLLTDIPVNTTSLNCSDSQLENLSSNLVKLTRLNCSNCPKLKVAIYRKLTWLDVKIVPILKK